MFPSMSPMRRLLLGKAAQPPQPPSRIGPFSKFEAAPQHRTPHCHRLSYWNPLVAAQRLAQGATAAVNDLPRNHVWLLQLVRLIWPLRHLCLFWPMRHLCLF